MADDTGAPAAPDAPLAPPAADDNKPAGFFDDVLGPPAAEKKPAGFFDDVLGPAPATPPPTAAVDDLGRTVASSPEMDEYYKNSGIGQVLKKVGESASSAYGTSDLGFSPETEAFLKKTGVFADEAKKQATVMQAFNQAFLRPAAAAVDAAARIASAAFSGATTGIAETATQVGGEQFGRGVGGIVEATTADLGSRMPMHAEAPGIAPRVEPPAVMPRPPLDLAEAYDIGIIGQKESVWRGLDETPQAANANVAGAGHGEPAEPAAEPASPATTPEAAAPQEAAPAPPADVHQMARQMFPDTFNEYDALAAHSNGLRQQLADHSTALQNAAEAAAPNAAEVANLRERLQDTTPRLAKKYQQRLDALLPEHDAFLADQDKMAALRRDTPEMATLRQQLLQTDYRMRDLAPDVSAAYARASEKMPAPALAETALGTTTEPAPQPEAAGLASATGQTENPEPQSVKPNSSVMKDNSPIEAAQPELVPVANAGEPAPSAAPAKPPVAPVASIAGDVSAKLQAAGRPIEEAEAAGQVSEAMWRARAEAFGGRKGTPEEMYTREAPGIVAGREKAGARTMEFAQDGRSLNQMSDEDWNALLARGEGQKAAAKRLAEEGRPMRLNDPHGGTVLVSKDLNHAPDGWRITNFDKDNTPTGHLEFNDAEEAFLYAARRYKDTDGRDLAQSINGKIRLANDGSSVITLMKSANASTFLHEMGHDWLERMMRDAADPDAPQQMRADAGAVRQYLGTGEGEAIPTRAHEKFARSFERYFMEGRAPTQALAGVFEKFKGWLTSIYQTVAKLRAPITDDIRDVFDRMLTSTPEDRAPSIVPESAADTAEPAAPKMQPLFPKPPKEPTRLIGFLRKMGGVRDEGGELMNIIGAKKARPGLVSDTGMTLDEAIEKAHEAGYFPEHGEDAPDVREFLDAVDSDLKNEPRYSAHDSVEVQRYNDVMDHNAAIDEMAHAHNIETAGLTREQFFEELSKRVSEEDFYNEMQSRAEAHEAEFGEFAAEAREWAESRGEKWDSDVFYDIDGPRTEAELESAYQSENAARSAGQGVSRGQEPGATAGLAGHGEEGGGLGGRDAGNAGRDGVEAGSAGAAGDGERDAAGSDAGADGAAKPDPLTPLKVKGEPPKFRSGADDEAMKAANIRLDKINGTQDLNDALRDLARQNGDFMDERYGTAAYKQQLEIRNTRVLLRSAVDELNQAALKAASGDPAAIADAVLKNKRATLVFGRLSTMSADWAHAGHELNKVMDGWDSTKALAARVQELGGKDLFQLQEYFAGITKMDTAEQAGKFAFDMETTPWDKFKRMYTAYFVNNLASGPITHLAYGIGNAVTGLYRAVPETLGQAAVSQIIGGAAEERVFYGEAGAQLYGMTKGALDGIGPALKAIRTGIPDLPGDIQGDLGFANSRGQQALPGRVGYALETPSRIVAGIHTFFYTMSYSQEISRLAYRDAASAGLRGEAFNVRVAALTSAPTAEMMGSASEAALRSVLMKRPEFGSGQYHLGQLVNNNIAAKTVMPFMQIGTNILTEGLVERTALSMLSSDARLEALGAKGKVAQSLRLGKIATGSMLGAATVGLAATGGITGGGPSDPKQRQLLMDQGWLPYSVKIGGMYIPYRKFLGYMGPLVAASADMYEIGHTAGTEDLSKTAAAIGFGFAEVVADETWMSGLSNFVDAVKNPDTKGSYYLRNLATSFMPFSVGMAQTARLVDPYARQANTLLEAFQNHIPFASEGLEPQIGIWGKPIASRTMVSPSTERPDPVDERLRALDIGVSPVEKKLVGIPLTEQQHTALAILSGTQAKLMLDQVVNSPGFSSNPPGIQTIRIKDALEKARLMAANTIKMQDMAIAMRTGTVSIAQQAHDNKMNLRINGRGGQ